MFRKSCGRRSRLPTPMTIQRESGGSGAGRGSQNSGCSLSAVGENCCQFLRWNDLQLSVGTVTGLLVGPPAAKLRGMAKAVSLHVVVCYFDHQLRTQRLPGEILPLTPSALPARHALHALVGHRFRPMPPRVSCEGIFAIRLEELDEFATLRRSETRADPDVLQSASVVEEAQQQGPDKISIPFFVPT